MAELWEARCRLMNTNTAPVQCAQNTLYLLAPSGVPDIASLATAIREAWQEVVWTLSSDVEFDGITLGRYLPAGGPRINVENTPHVLGRAIGQTLPTGVGVEAIRRTAVRGKRTTSKLWLPWTLQNMMDPDFDNQIAEASALAIENALNGTIAHLAGGGSVGVPLIPVVFSRRSAADTKSYEPVTYFEVVRHYRNLAKRGRRSVECLPFVPTPVSDGGLAVGSRLLPFGWDGAHNPFLVNGWRYLETRAGEPVPAEPVDWQGLDFDDSDWTGLLAVSGMGGQPPEPYSGYALTPCLDGPSELPGIVNPPDWHDPASAFPPHEPTSNGFVGIYWIGMDVDHLLTDTWPDRGDAWFRCRFSDAEVGPIVTARLEVWACDSCQVWLDNELIVDQPDDETYSGHLPHWEYVNIGERLGPGEHQFAIRVRARRSIDGGICPGDALPRHGGRRFELLYGDCTLIDFLCRRDTLIGVNYDQYFGMTTGLAFRLWTTSAPPGTPVVE